MRRQYFIIFGYLVFGGFVGSQILHDLLEGLLPFEMLKHYFEPHSRDVVEVLTASHDAGIDEVFLAESLQLRQCLLPVWHGHRLELLVTIHLSVAEKIKLHHLFRASIGYEVRVLRYRKVCDALLDHIRHLCVCLIRSYHKLDFDLVEDVHEKINHPLPEHKRPSVVPPCAFDIPLLICLLSKHSVLQLRLEPLLFCRLLGLQVKPIENTYWLDTLARQKPEHFQRES